MNKDCPYSKKDIWNYYSNALSQEEEVAMQEHILLCNTCKTKLKQLRELGRILDEENIETNHIEIERKNPIRKYLIIAASIAALILAVFLIIPTSEKTDYPIDEINGDSYSTGDSSKVDSLKIEMKLDTIY
ncbi:hypothetical protein CLV62_14430 [Dysgonomonas alginatilytica]|uniref:Uncharacterized protein n=1 Tax=Dysgonomonas alginatilytica TaxID=1605892 RepID=A0A2V3PJR7_9BACT|nr:hypothetical protein [Dysgonomonas alginatilytica]PXV58818.1 hypothetical protein CLV62_14430 [Dysgonomonas alginatilytica]